MPDDDESLAASELPDEELDEELTIAAARHQRDMRYIELHEPTRAADGE